MQFRFLGILLFGFQFNFLFSQQIINIEFIPTINGENFALETTYKFNNGQDSIQFDALKFYISKIEFFKENSSVFKETNSIHLIDAEIEKSKILNLNVGEQIHFDKIKFALGIDSTTNVSGAFGGDLDPTKGMYWTWQSGYINFKLEGKSNLCDNREKEFQLHLGGYQNENNALQEVRMSTPSTNALSIEIDLSVYLQSFDLNKINRVMSPSPDAVALSKKIAQCFKLTQR